MYMAKIHIYFAFPFKQEKRTTNNALISSLPASANFCGLLIFYSLDPNYAGHKVELDLDSN